MMSARSLRKRELGACKVDVVEKMSKIRVRKGTAGSYKKGKSGLSGQGQTSDSKSGAKKTMEYLRDLPSYNKSNFSKFRPDRTYRPTARKARQAVSTTETMEHPFEQLIIQENTTIQLKLLQQQYERKMAHQMRLDPASAGPSGMSGATSRKKSRMQFTEP